ncbi:isoleucine--tRNA ligase [Candidatus Pacearchaeota archaeon CG10_big_fil_rev_8_21_14_0_10_31_24]|nr:MAG: isoleucine--tRNA ligase [Candidatus Pacearchaeota archaeon CG10_big_fil_rev_8_21_14_0_10_31_24]
MYNPQETEKEVLKFWAEKKIFEKRREKNKGKRKWSFIDGPITANNPMGVHHAWGRTYKDLFHRFRAMQGFDIRYQNGFDCQGLWVEREEEKDLGLKNKEDIEKFGILKFVQSCRKRVEKFSKIQRDQSIKLGQWMDWDNSYYTMSDNNILHNWHLLKTYFDKGWLYKGFDSVPWCWRCGTASSKHDIATEGYKDVTHTALYMQFPLKSEPDTHFLIFTTTPWTVPANVAIALNPNVEYVKIECDDGKYWLAETRLEEINGKYKVLDKKMGSELKDLEYIMPYSSLSAQKDSPHKVVLWDLASGEEGTGIVHIAPGCGAEDFDLGKKEGLPVISPLNENGFYMDGYDEFSASKYSEVNKKVLVDLEQRQFVYKTEKIRHRYPHCWRCGEELVFRVVDEWYIKSEKIRSTLIKENRKVNWYPEYGKKRQEEWFKNMGDWLISRKRYWGLPLPIWSCECGQIEVFGNLEELKKKVVDKSKVDNLPEIHRPWIDEIKIKCKCGKTAERIKDVGDAWLDAGIVPFSTLNYLNDNKYWKEWFPADMITESIPGQFRGWFNALFWASVTLTGKAPFKSLFGYETLKDEKGNEMHKSTGNAIWFDDAVEKIGADPIRFLYSLQDPSQELKFGYNVVKEPRNNLNILENINKLIYSSQKTKVEKVEDKWILSKFNTLIDYVTKELEGLRPHQAMRELQNFWLNDLSRGYIQFVRDRLSEEDASAKFVLGEVYSGLIQLCAPFVPFISEKIWQSLREKKIVEEESVHLNNFLKPNKKLIDKKLEEDFDNALKIIELGLAERDKFKIGLRWPLKSVGVEGISIFKETVEIVKRQLNVKEVILEKGENIKVILDLKITKELEAEGFARELARKVQAERKNAGFKKGELINLEIFADDEVCKMFVKHNEFLKSRTNSKDIYFSEEEFSKDAIVFTVKERKIGLKFS